MMTTIIALVIPVVAAGMSRYDKIEQMYTFDDDEDED